MFSHFMTTDDSLVKTRMIDQMLEIHGVRTIGVVGVTPARMPPDMAQEPMRKAALNPRRIALVLLMSLASMATAHSASLEAVPQGKPTATVLEPDASQTKPEPANPSSAHTTSVSSNRARFDQWMHLARTTTDTALRDHARACAQTIAVEMSTWTPKSDPVCAQTPPRKVKVGA